jgi:hypothetical protein
MHFRGSKSCRTIHAIFMVFIIAYILFDVLDLDGSEWPSVTHPIEKSFVAAEPTIQVESAHRPDRSGLWDEIVAIENGLHAAVLPHTFQIPLFSQLDSARMHHYRVGLPRDAIPD